MKDFLQGLLSLIVALGLLLVGGELFFRVHHFIKEATSGNTILVYEIDEHYGWRTARDFHFSGELLDAGGRPYEASVSFDENGLRAFGNPAVEDRPKVLFLGDSFTQAEQVSDENTYYSILQQRFSFELFVLAVGGYGTQQQYMLLDQYIDQIEPDLVVFQFSPNDILNNSFALESQSVRNNNSMRRPYFEDGRLEYRLPRSNAALWEIANNYSRVLYFVMTRLDRLRPLPDDSVEQRMERLGVSFAPYREALDTTALLLRKMRERIPADTLVLAFSAQNSVVFEQLAQGADMRHIGAVPGRLEAARSAGVTVAAADGSHWNNEGHRIVADTLAPYVEEAAGTEDVAPTR